MSFEFEGSMDHGLTKCVFKLLKWAVGETVGRPPTDRELSSRAVGGLSLCVRTSDATPMFFHIGMCFLIFICVFMGYFAQKCNNLCFSHSNQLILIFTAFYSFLLLKLLLSRDDV